MTSQSFVSAPKTVLVVDDDQDMCWALASALGGAGHTATTVGLAGEAIALLAGTAFLIAFVDARLPDMDGLQLVQVLRGLQPDMRLIMISGYYLEDDACILEAIRGREIDGFLAKPFRIDAIIGSLAGVALSSGRAIGESQPAYPVSTTRIPPLGGGQRSMLNHGSN